MYKPNPKKAFTMAEAILVMAILGLIAAVTIPQLIKQDPSQKGMLTMGQKMYASLTQATMQMLIYNTGSDDLIELKNGDVKFKITDADAAAKMSKLFQVYLSKINDTIDTTDPYFASNIMDYQRNLTGTAINSYSNFFMANDGVLLGFKFYGSCEADETLAIAPKQTVTKTIPKICGSIFVDVNSFKKPNKLGTDQFIIPMGKRGVTYED